MFLEDVCRSRRQTRAVPLLLAFNVLMLLQCSSTSADECNGHGHKTNNTCNCDNPTPSLGQEGWSGVNCDMRVYGIQLDGNDVTESCSSSNCKFLAARDWACFFSPITWNNTANPWNYLNIQLNNTSDDDLADPDLYGWFYKSDGSGPRPGKSSSDYHFQDLSSRGRSVVQVVKRSGLSMGSDYQGVYMCIKAYGRSNVTFSLRSFLSKCPGGFSDEGEKMECSSTTSASEKRHTGCNDDGTCQCKAPYAKPVQNTYADLGFEDCSAKVVNITAEQFRDSVFLAEHESVNPRAWNFYSFGIDEQDFQVVINVGREEDNIRKCSKYGFFRVFAKFGQPPGFLHGQSTFQPRFNYYAEDDNDQEIVFDKTQDGFQTGRWYVGVNGDSADTCNYTLTISKYECPLNCSGQGQCIQFNNGTNVCQCNKGYYGRDCAQQSAALVYGQQISKPGFTFEYQYFELPSVTPAMLTHPVEVRFAASFSSQDYAPYVSARPELLLLKGDASSLPASGNYTLRAILEKQNQTYYLDVCPSQLSQGNWKAAVYNPLGIYKVAYNLTVTKTGFCLNNCTGHGTCSEDGICECSANWAGGDCSVDTSGLPCVSGTLHADPRPAQKGTCWQLCQCSGGDCSLQSECSNFTCDSKELRRKGNSDECIQDKCTQGEWEDTESYSCLKECSCPADGAECILQSGCKADNFACKQGFQRYSSNEPKCYMVGCQQGTLQEAPGVKVDNGKAYGTCLCQGEESPDQPRCSVPETDPGQMTIVCQAGYSLKGAVQAASSAVLVGGTCIKSKPGTPAWGVVLWIFFSLLIGGAGGVGLLWYYESKLRSSSAHNNMYHELSMDTGF